MRARSSSWLLLSLVVLSALVAAELHFEVGTSPGGDQAVGQASVPVEAAPVPLFGLADRESFSQTLTRPLFMPNRQPLLPEAAGGPVEAPRAPAQASANPYALSAIIIVDDERIALLTDTATGGMNRVREGESIAGWQVEKIHEDRAVISNGDTREELSLRTFGPPAARPKSPTPRTGTRRQTAAQPSGKNRGASPKRPRRSKRKPRQALPIPGTETD